MHGRISTRDFSWGTMSSSWAGTGEPGSETWQGLLGATAPPACSSGSCQGAVGSQPAPDFWSAPEGLAAGELAVRPSWGLDSAWLLPFLTCAGAREKMPPNPAAPGPCPGDGRAAPTTAGSAPACATGPALPRSQPSPGTTAGAKKGIECEAQEATGCARCPGVGRCRSLHRQGGLGAVSEAAGGPSRAGSAEGSLLVPPLGMQRPGVPSSELWGTPRQSSDGEMLPGSSSSWLPRSRLPGPELGRGCCY